MRRDSAVQQPAAARSSSSGAPSSGAPAPRGPRPPARRPRLRLTRRGVVVLGVAAVLVLALVVSLVVAVVRLLGGPADPAVPAPVVAEVPESCVPDATTSQNCWPAFDDGADPLLEVSPWVTGRLRGGDARYVLEHVAARFDAEVEAVDVASSWGWGYRTVRGEEDEAGEGLSNHASGTSIDLNATEHPLGARDTFTDEQVAAIRSILAEVAPAVAWGGDFAGRRDEMHFEIVASPETVAEVAARLRGGAPPG
ncbi:M15 family metallopeptidase [Cellulomonas sp. ACRRI]|uniref:M15 family metallopeptidase n=1 Tax=Cellulomonas sp. ACRRI TaxID=2918188 RepID=UPI001EF2B8FD|nr:M15 family metallopeptidase [Cellulomonas sp. ACRRI]MCG7287949.1 M15 family metallopeptidase [Cellulomonas sp. ACRRI]